ncbi:N,N-dimethylformamidase beta subunit family domain-containing protein [Stieleria varia]|uniref:N,N-dimethylformamidase beta subunit family domain-containing protein n=1 Tax=Stieleria varia TaxID=2528005 RepID=UPI0018D206BD|nr:N,N-dimethylformamidase beta subunit family domain-containing protein [Stieleria varia]
MPRKPLKPFPTWLRLKLCVVVVTTLFLTTMIETGAHAGEPAAADANIVQRENARQGSTDWQLTRVRLDRSDGCRSPAIEGYCSKQSVAAGETLQIMVSTDPAESFQIEIFRTGYYGGRGARLMTTLGPFAGKAQPVPKPDERTMHECQWEPSTELTIPDDWPSGVYLGRLTTLPPAAERPYWQSYVIFIVRDARPADILFQCSDNTWQAYNGWPYKSSVYTHPKGNQGPWADVSFDRPYGREAQYTSVVNDPLSVGSGGYLTFEFPMVYWLEQQGYDVSYCSNSDLLTPERGQQCKAFLSVGHDEYWDIRQYNSVVAMRDAGVNLMFFSGNSVCWVTPLTSAADGRPNRIMFRGGPYGGDYKWAQQREQQHGPFPHRGPDEGYLMGARNSSPVNGGGDWICTKPDHWVFEGTGMKQGDRIPGLIGWEYHGDPPSDLPGLEIVGQGTAWQGGTNPSPWTATIYPGPKDNFVFNAATIFWSQGLSMPPGHTLPWSHWSRPHGPDSRVQQITRNLLSRAGCRQGESTPVDRAEN